MDSITYILNYNQVPNKFEYSGIYLKFINNRGVRLLVKFRDNSIVVSYLSCYIQYNTISTLLKNLLIDIKYTL